jgi:hypothetical protein
VNICYLKLTGSYGDDAGNVILPLITASATLSPRSYTTSNGDLKKHIAYRIHPRDWNTKQKEGHFDSL